MNLPDLEREILGNLVLRTPFIELEDLSSREFFVPRLGQVFGIISDLWENDRPAEISLQVLAQRLGGDEAEKYAFHLIDGIHKISPDDFRQLIREWRWMRGTREIGRALSHELALQEKTGATDRAAWEQIFEKVDGLRRSTGSRISLAERSAESIRIRAIPWLWHGVMPTHMATAITGDAGQGKSLVAVDLAARVSRGVAFPVYDKLSPPVCGHVFYITSEGVPEMILVPRLMAAGADLSKITIIEGVYQRKDHFQMFDITRNLPDIERRTKDFPDLKLIIVDPIASFLPERINPNQGNQVRQAMDRISELAFKLGIALPTVMHFAKAPGGKAIHKTSGNAQWEAAVKMSWSVIRRESDPRNVRLLVPQKSNITSGHESLSFSIQSAEFSAPDNPNEIISTAKIAYGEHVDEDPEMLICPPVEKDGDTSRAVEFLKQKMAAGGIMFSREIVDQAKEEGIPDWSIKRARVKLGLKADKEDKFQGRSFWFTPKAKP